MSENAVTLAARTAIGGRYEILGLLGAGGMGCVYRARDTKLDELVALKLLTRDLANAPGMLERFRQEVKLARKVTHKNVVRTFDLGEDAGEHFLTMELVEGESLSSQIASERRLSIPRTLEIACAVCDGLGAAHAAGVLHRDLKPDNVLLAKDGRVLITDFGIARALEQGKVTMGIPIGTPAYMAPEQLEASPTIDARADQYAFGVMLFEMLTGELPFNGNSAYAIAAARLLQPPPDPRGKRPDLPESVALTIMRCMARKPEDRFATIDEIATRLGSATLPALSIAPPQRSVPAWSQTNVSKTVAVLPLRNAGAESDDYIAEGLTDDLIDGLSMTSGLRVRPRSAVMHLRGQTRDSRDVGRELGVQVVAEGSVRMLGDAARITVRLVSVTDGFQLWAKRFDVSKGDLLRAADEAATSIANALAVERKDVRPVVTDAAAVDLYLRAKHEYYKFDFDAVERATQLLEEAVSLRPDDPLVLSASAMALARKSQFRSATPAIIELSYEHAKRALMIAPELTEPLIAMAMVDLHRGDPVSTARHVRAALQRSTNFADAHDIAARLLQETGPRELFERHANIACALDPRVRVVSHYGLRFPAFEEDWATVDAAFGDMPSDQGLSIVYLNLRARYLMWARNTNKARELSERQDIPGFVQRTLKLIATRELDPQLADDFEMRARGGATLRASGFMAQMGAETYAYLEDYDRSFEFLKRAASNHVFDIQWLEGCPLFKPMRTLPAYADVRDTIESLAAKIRQELV